MSSSEHEHGPDCGAVSPCPMCGSFTGTTLAVDQAPVLLAVADVLVVKALEKVGKMLARNGGNRNRVKVASSTPWHKMHTVLPSTPKDIDKGLHGAWDVIPAMLDTHGCCGVTSRQVEQMVDSYVRDLLITGSEHQFGELRYRFESFLDIPLSESPGYAPAAPVITMTHTGPLPSPAAMALVRGEHRAR